MGVEGGKVMGNQQCFPGGGVERPERNRTKLAREVVMLEGQEYHVLGKEVENKGASCFGPEKPQGQGQSQTPYK